MELIRKHYQYLKNRSLNIEVALAEWLRRVPAKYMGSPRESSNLSGDVSFSPPPLPFFFFLGLHLSGLRGWSRPIRKTGLFNRKSN
jgi:hypothetical protein